jgi:hypothetical protein
MFIAAGIVLRLLLTFLCFFPAAAVSYTAHGNSATRQNPRQHPAPFVYARIACPNGMPCI